MKFNNATVEDFYEYMSRISRKAYSDPYLIANDVLCKQDTQGRVLERCISGDAPQKVTFLFAAKKVVLYFFKSLAAYLAYVFIALAHRLSRQFYRLPEKGELVILDIYCRIRAVACCQRNVGHKHILIFFSLKHLLNQGKMSH